jgi:hypothetical protein
MKRGMGATITTLNARRELHLIVIAEQRILTLQEITSPMRTSSEGIAGKNRNGGAKPAEIARLLWPRMVEFWIFMAIAIFFLIRVLGSHAAQRLLSGIGRHHLP